MQLEQVIIQLREHVVVFAIPFVLGVLNAVLRTRTATQWVELGERMPRVQGLLRLMRGVGIDPIKVVNAGKQIVSGKAAASFQQPSDLGRAAYETFVDMHDGHDSRGAPMPTWDSLTVRAQSAWTEVALRARADGGPTL